MSQFQFVDQSVQSVFVDQSAIDVVIVGWPRLWQAHSTSKAVSGRPFTC